VLWDTAYYKDWAENNKSRRLQHEFTDYIAQKEFKSLTSNTALSDLHVTKSEKIRSLQAKEHPDASILPQLFRAH
jgi:hypothetical protein